MRTDRGIDYSGGGSVNRDTTTGIHYGVISMHEVMQAWTDSSEAFYAPCCPYCGNEIAKNYEMMVKKKRCPQCKQKFDESSFDMNEPASFYLDDGEYQATQSQDDTDIFITKSPYYTLCSYCSPCAPGAGYIMDSRDEGIKAYCFGHNWFEDGKAPYPVFRVDTGERIKP
jgi:ribosomal protein L37AE/L43A